MNVHHLIVSYGYTAVLLLVLAESFGVPLPGETGLVAAATYAATTHRLSVVVLFLVAAAAAVAGDVIGYVIGRTGGWRLVRRFGRVVRIDEPKIKVARYLFDRHGAWVVVGGRFVAILRTYSAILAGTSQMEVRRFVVADAVGGAAWAAVYSFGAYGAGSFIARSSTPFEIGAGCAAAVVAVTLVLLIRHRFTLLEARADAAYPGPVDDWHRDPDQCSAVGVARSAGVEEEAEGEEEATAAVAGGPPAGEDPDPLDRDAGGVGGV